MSIAADDASLSEREFLEELFAQLNQEGIRYAVMRNHETLPYSAGGSDLDLIVDPECRKSVRAVLFGAIKNAGGIPIGVAETAGFFKVYILGLTPNHPRHWWGLRLDVNISVHYKGIRLLVDSEVDFLGRKHNGVAVLPDGLAGVLGVLKEVLNNGKFPMRYAAAARKAADVEWARISVQLAPLGDDALVMLRDLLHAKTVPGDLASLCGSMRKSVLRNAMSENPSGYAIGRIRFECSKLLRYLNPPGIVIAILGVDGAGKSTVINAILPALQAATHNAVWVQHLRPGFLPPLARLKGKKDVQSGPVLEPHGSRPSGFLGSAFRLTYLTLDYILGYWSLVRPKIAKQPTIVLFDRYAYDMMLDPRRFRIGLSSRVASWFCAFAPKPDLILCLQGDPVTIAARKQELSVEETARQVEALRAFAKNEKRAVLINTVANIEDTRDQALLALHGFLSRRMDSGLFND